MDRRTPIRNNNTSEYMGRRTSQSESKLVGQDPIEIRANVHRSLSALVQTKHEISTKLDELRQSEANLTQERPQFQQVLNSYLLDYLKKVETHLSNRQENLRQLARNVNDNIHAADGLFASNSNSNWPKEDWKLTVQRLESCLVTCRQTLDDSTEDNSMPELDPFGQKRIGSLETARYELEQQHQDEAEERIKLKHENEDLRELVAELTVEKEQQSLAHIQHGKTLDQAREDAMARAMEVQQQRAIELERQRDRDRKQWNEKEQAWKQRIATLESTMREEQEAKLQVNISLYIIPLLSIHA